MAPATHEYGSLAVHVPSGTAVQGARTSRHRALAVAAATAVLLVLGLSSRTGAPARAFGREDATLSAHAAVSSNATGNVSECEKCGTTRHPVPHPTAAIAAVSPTAEPSKHPVPKPTLDPSKSPVPAPTGVAPTPAPSNKEPTGTPTPKPSSPPGLPLLFEFASEYPAPQSMGYYPWQHLVEPFRETTVRPVHKIQDAKYGWTMTLPAAGSTKEDQMLLNGHYEHEITYTFKEAGKFYNIKLDEWSTSHGHRYYKGAVICKYVRRELRKLTDMDRTLYIDAIRQLYSLEMTQGKAMYGRNFRNAEYFNRKHLSAMSIEWCSPWHTSAVFLTAHAAFTREFEMALQSIHPVLAAPYWEYTIDSEKYGDMWSVNSPIFGDDFFGHYPVNSPFVVDSGPLAYLGLPKNWSSPEHSPYGYIMDNFSPDPTPYVTRSASMCGIQTRAPLPTCNKLKKVLNTTNLYDFRDMVETFYHAELHPLIGGAWDCKYANVKTLVDKNPNITRYAEDILTDLGILLRYGYSVQKNFSHGVLGPGMAGWGSEWGDIRCPHDCDTPMFYNITAQRRNLGAQAESGFKHPFLCTCTIDKVRIPLEEHKELSFEYAVHVLDANKLLDKLYDATGTSAATVTNYDDDWPTKYDAATSLFYGLDKADTAALIMWFAKLFAYFPRVGPMTAILGSPADPVFWPSHGAWERLWHYQRITQLWINEFDEDKTMLDWGRWRPTSRNNPTDTCHWSKKAYSMLPFWDLMDHTSPDDVVHHLDDDVQAKMKHSYYTNADLNQMFAPDQVTLPFIFDSFQWDHCDQWDSKNGPAHMGTMTGPTEPITDRETFRAKLRMSVWSDLGDMYETAAANDHAHLPPHEMELLRSNRAWLYDDEDIHHKIDWHTGEARSQADYEARKLAEEEGR